MKKPWLQTLLMAGLLLVVTLVVFHRSFSANETLFSNDGPLGVQMNPSFASPACFFGMWGDGSLLGYYLGTYSLSLGTMWLFLFDPLHISKWLVPMCIWLSGVGGLLLGRRMGLKPGLAFVMGLATMLNNNTFTGGTWGLGGRATMAACALLCLAAVWKAPSKGGWLHFALGGFCIGLGIIDSADVGAIYSVFLGLFVFFQAFGTEGSWPVRVLRGAARTALMAACAALISWQFITTLIDTNIKGVVGAQAATNPEDKEKQWHFATQWSTPKAETLRVLIPGLFGLRMDTPDNGHYWGRVGQMAQWVDATPEQKAQLAQYGGARYNGSGEYAGILILLGGLFAVFLAARRSDTTFTKQERLAAGIWSALAVVALLLAWGRWAPFYRIVYSLPYFHTIRNPMKFMHVVHLALQVLFCLGLVAIARRHLGPITAKAKTAAAAAKGWWSALGRPEKQWTFVVIGLFVISLAGWMTYTSARSGLERHLLEEYAAGDAAGAAAVADYSLKEVRWYLLFLVLGGGLFLLIFSGRFAGQRAKLAVPVLALFVLADLYRADAPWVVYYDFKQLYASNPMFETMRQNRLDHRVALALSQPRTQEEMQSLRTLQGIYQQFWLHKVFPYYALLSLDISQMPRALVDYESFMRGEKAALPYNQAQALPRLWEVASTRWLLGIPSGVEYLNQLDGNRGRFRLHTAFGYQPKPNVARATSAEELDYVPQPNGPLALIEFTGALPRAKLFAQWQVETNDDAALKLVASPTFDPQQTVIVNEPLAASTGATTNAGTVELVASVYKPTFLQLKADVKAPAVLLLTDKNHEYWQATVDGAPAKVLRCNYLMRGVRLEPGTHTVEFRLKPPIKSQWLNLVGIVAALGICGYLALAKPRTERAVAVAEPPRTR